MKIIFTSFKFLLLFLIFNIFSKNIKAQCQIEVGLKNLVQTSPATIEMDLVIRNSGNTQFGITALGGGYVYPPGLVPAGSTMTGTITLNPCFAGLNLMSNGNLVHQSATRMIRWNQPPTQGFSIPVCGPGINAIEQIYAHLQLNLNGPNVFPSNFPLSFSATATGAGLSATVYCGTSVNSSSLNVGNPGTFVNSPAETIILNPTSNCPISLNAHSINTCCCGASGQVQVDIGNGSNTGTYSLNGGAPINYTSNPFTLTGITQGIHTIEVIQSGCSPLIDTFEVPIISTTGTPNVSNVTACNSYFFPPTNQTYTSSGTYAYVNPANCNSNDTLNLTINTPSISHTNITSCNSHTWLVNNQTYSASGNYAFVNSANCTTDSLHLTITPPLQNPSIIISACDSFAWSANGQTYTVSGNYAYINSANCSVDSLYLTITPLQTNSSNISSCGSYYWNLNGQVYTASGNYTYLDSANCILDSLNLTIVPMLMNSNIVSACDSFLWNVNGQTYTATGIYTSIDSINCVTDSLYFTLTPPSANTTISVTACDSFFWHVNGQTYTASGTYVNNAACLLDTLQLTINGVTALLVQTGNTLSVTTSASNYQWIDCATNTAIPGATNQTFTPIANGQYKVAVSQGNCTDTTACVTVTGLAVEDNISSNFTFYPNPTSGLFTIARVNNFSNFNVEVYNITGKKILSQSDISTQKIFLDLSEFSSGLYVVKIVEGEKIEHLKIRKH